MNINELSDESLNDLTDWSVNLLKSSEEVDFYLAEQISDIKDRYLCGELIGTGSTKDVYSAYDCVTDRDVAYARLKDNSAKANIDAFLYEARMTADLQHPNIMPVYDIGLEESGVPYFTMKKVTQDNLRGLLNNKNYDIYSLLDIFLKMCEALEYTHSVGIIHLDLKPENICVSRFGEVIVCDWGLARQTIQEENKLPNNDGPLKHNFTLRGHMRGTPGYMAPEQVKGAKSRKDHRTDIYSLGTILYEMLFKRLPVKGTSIEEILTNTKMGNILPTHSSNKDWAGIKAISLKALSLDPKDRYQTTSELIEDVRHFLRGFAPQAEDASPWRRALLFYQRSRSLINLAAISLIVVTTLITLSFISLAKKETKAQTALQSLALEKQERIRLGRKSFPQILTQCQTLYLKGDFEQAKNYLNMLTEINENDKRVQSLHAKIAFLTGDFELAQRKLRDASSPLEKYLLLYLRDEKKGRDSLALACQVARTEENYLILEFLISTAKKDQFHTLTQSIEQYSHINNERLLELCHSIKETWKKKKLLELTLKSMQSRPENIFRRNAALKGVIAAESWPDIQESFRNLVPENLALGRPIFSSAFEESSPSKAVDGNLENSNYWAGSPLPAALILDLETVQKIKTIKLYFYYSDPWPRAYYYQVLTSRDGKDYSILEDRSHNMQSSKKEGQILNFAAIETRFIKIKILKNSANNSAHIREIEVYN